MSLGDRLRKILVTAPAPRELPRQPSDPAAVDTWFGPFLSPGTPIAPIVGAAEPRYFDYTAGVNANTVPRTEYEMIPNFRQLWTGYLTMPILRIMVTFRTQQILSLDWKIKLRSGSGFRSAVGLDQARKLLEHPDPQMDYGFEQFARQVLEEICVTDALSIRPIRNRLKKVMGFMQIDGSTVKVLIDYERGGIPVPPDPAFVQYIKGTAYTQFTSEELIYRPFRPRVWCVYGQSRVENVLSAAALYQLHENWTGDYFEQGNIPEVAAMIDPNFAQSLPPAKFQEWQTILDKTAGLNVGRRRIHLMPPWVKDIKPLKDFKFDRQLPDWMVRLLCIEFGVPSFLFTAETNRATAKEMNEVIHDTPLRGDLMMMKRVFDKLLETAGYEEAEFDWQKQPDYSTESVSGVVSLAMPPVGVNPVMTVAEARLFLGLSDEDELDDQALGSEDTEVGPDDAPETAPAPVDPPPQQAAPTPAPATPAPTEAQPEAKVVPINRARKALKVPAKKLIGPDAAKKATLTTALANVVLKRMRQQQAKVMQEAVARARARGKRVKGA